ncbi:hypothetical protein TNCV_276281 [Trichonephila clavipes]|nr:hypothetical protein TNCV_276281 [Trichonephila clavipes]
MVGRNMRKLTVSEALEYMRQLSENESENNGEEEYVFSDDEYVPPNEENISSNKDTVFNIPIQCTSRKSTSEKKKQCVHKRKKLSYSNPDEMNSGTFVTKDGTCRKSITSRSCMCGRISEHNIFKERVVQPVMKSEILNMAMQLVHGSYF